MWVYILDQNNLRQGITVKYLNLYGYIYYYLYYIVRSNSQGPDPHIFQQTKKGVSTHDAHECSYQTLLLADKKYYVVLNRN